MSPKPQNSYSLVVQWATVRLVLILQCLIVLKSQSIDFTIDLAQEDILSGETVFIKLSRDFNIDGGKGDVALKLNKILYGQSEAARLWYENLRSSLLESGFVMSKVDPCLFISNTVICLFWVRSQSEIDNVMKYFC